ncbi:hypothetical protein [Tenacibaculum sp. A30]|uniref:hypothetical protein n=1 Tax=Tenacibaculum sp. A30 TaxID=3442644 RepID=UPI003EBBCA29
MKLKRGKIVNFLSIVLLLGITVFMLSCETDETIDSNPNKVIQGEYLTFNELKSVDFNVVERIEKLNLEQDVLSKEESVKLNNLFFDKSLVLKLKTKTSTSYTFAVSSNDFLKNQIYNLVVTKYNDGKIIQHLVSYFITSTGEFKINNAINLKLGTEFYQNKTDGCAPRLVTETEEDTSSCIYLSCKGYLDGKPLSHSFGDTSCGFYGDPMLGARRECTTNTITTWSYDCQSGGGGVTDTGTDYPVGGGTNGSTRGSTNDSIEEVTTITSPVYLLPASLSKSLTIEEREWLFDENNKGAYDSLVTYLSTDSSLEAATFAEQAIEIYIDLNNFETLLDTPTFDALETPWLKTLREYAKRLEQLKDKISKEIWDDLNKYLDQQLTKALTKTAFKLNPDANQTKEANKEYAFKNDGKKGGWIFIV